VNSIPANRGFRNFLLLTTVLASVAGSHAAERKSLKGHVPISVAKLQAVASLPPWTNLNLAIGLPLRDSQGLSNFLADIYNPASASYHHYLTPEEFTKKFGPTKQDYEKVIEFARANGLTVTATHPNRLVLDVSGPVSSIEKAFQIRLRVYPHPTEQRNFYGPDTEPSVPANLPILDVTGLDDFAPPRPAGLKQKKLPSPKSQSQAQNTPNDLDSDFVSFATGGGPGGDFIGSDFRRHTRLILTPSDAAAFYRAPGE
jgi:subtilase family serine protease